ncbi:Rha family transcriptional regulator [Enterococcus sp. HY326]|uniref:Rha family transcriptional regulator n=1 Tax=Enterococcus sp. HY326 TaxID=2971265 RepID=UPI0022409A8C|nr:Rha family transcriptional regulator [Enterococcus sp. HY326]
MQELTFDVIIRNRNVVVSSLNVADIFQKQHKNVLQTIDNLKDDWKELSKELGLIFSPVKNKLGSKLGAVPIFKDFFFESSYLTKDGRTVRSYNMNRTGFTLLANGFNGKKALRFKLAYIAQFDAMEEELIKRNTLYDLEKRLRDQLRDTIKASYGDNPPDRIYMLLTNLLYIAVADHTAEKIKRDRGFEHECSVFADIFTSDERTAYIDKENELIRHLRNGELDYYNLKDQLLEKAL